MKEPAMSANSSSPRRLQPRAGARVLGGLVLVQVVVVLAFGTAWGTLPAPQRRQVERQLDLGKTAPLVPVERDAPLRIAPLYDDPQVVSDSQLLAVLARVAPRFEHAQLKPNFAEHALRTWGVDARFDDPGVLSGEDMRDFLLNHAKFMASWGERMDALLVDTPTGISVRYGREQCGSVHHDHALACLAEAGAPLSQPVFSPGRSGATLHTTLHEALRDFRLDERETEWSTLLFALYLPPHSQWQNGAGREISFDLLARRLMRGDKRLGVCSGTHRVYSLMVLVRLDDEYDLLSDTARGESMTYLGAVRDLLLESQFEDGRWPPDWSRGAKAISDPGDGDLYQTVIATGHHLEWLAIAPEALHPPRERVVRAARWVIENTLSRSDEEISRNYTYYSHVGAALAAWRQSSAWEFWDAHQSPAPAAAETL